MLLFSLKQYRGPKMKIIPRIWGKGFFFFPSSCYHCRLSLFTNILPSDVHHKGVRSSHILHSSEHTIGNKCIVKKCKSGTITNKQQGFFFFFACLLKSYLDSSILQLCIYCLWPLLKKSFNFT